MPEITSRDRINKKLQDFDTRLDGALSAVETMIRQKEATMKLVASMERSEEESSSLLVHLERIQEEWGELKDGVAEAQGIVELSSQLLLEQFDRTRSNLEQHFNQEVEKIHQANTAFRDEHYHFAEQSRTDAEKTDHAVKSVAESVSRSEQLMVNIKQDLHGEIEERLAKNELLTGNWLEKVDNEWKEKIASLKQSMEEELSSFKRVSEDFLKRHQRGVEQHLTEFLGKQNVLVQNLAQQIDGFQRTMQAFANAQQAVGEKLELLEEVVNKISTQEAVTGTLQNETQALNARLEQTINRLQGLRFVGSSFKDL